MLQLPHGRPVDFSLLLHLVLKSIRWDDSFKPHHNNVDHLQCVPRNIPQASMFNHVAVFNPSPGVARAMSLFTSLGFESHRRSEALVLGGSYNLDAFRLHRSDCCNASELPCALRALNLQSWIWFSPWPMSCSLDWSDHCFNISNASSGLLIECRRHSPW
jgi:hypothetical protein